MAPPQYKDLGKNARDIFSDGYHFGLMKLDVKSQTNSGVTFSSSGVSNQDTGKVFGTLETKYKIKEYGLTFCEKWNTENTLGTEVTIADKLLNGLTLGYSCTFSPHTGARTGKLTSSYLHENVAASADFDLSLSGGPVVNAQAVVGYQGWLAGYQASFDTQRNKLTSNNFSLGYTASDFSLHTSVDNGRDFHGSIYHKVKPGLQGAINLAWSSTNNVTQFGLATKYELDKEAFIRTKVNSHLQIGLGYQQTLRKGVSLILSTNIDGKNFSSGGHKIGLALKLEA